MSGSGHVDVAAYALGVLDAQDAERFETHLIGCSSCAAELESFLPVVDLLSEIDRDHLVLTERVTDDKALLDRTLAAVAAQRRRSRSRRLFALAAGIALLVGVGSVAGIIGARMAEPEVTAHPPVTATDEPTGPWVTGAPGPGLGGPDAPDGERFGGTDPATGVRADLIVEDRPFGTQVSFALSGLSGPRTCRLVVLRRSGSAEVISSWSVPRAGYGTPAQPQPLLLQAATAVPRADIDRIQVQYVDPAGVAHPLVTVPL